MGSSWARARRKDAFYKKAKREGYASRASYKLQEIDQRFHVFRRASTVVDLGAAPGGWSQVALEAVGADGRVIAIDLKPITVDGVVALQGDLTQPETIALIRDHAKRPVATVLSDMSPNISGNYTMDHARSVHLAEIALEAATQLLEPGGCFVVKVFQGDLFKSYYDRVNEHFSYRTALSPKATRKGSSEAYVIGKRFHG